MTTSTGDLLRVIDGDFRRGTFRTSAPPSRFYVNLTERCQLQCAHCITQAPVMTKNGTARTLGDDVLTALRPHLRHATYLGFTHAGEPILSPALDGLLQLVRDERRGEPTIVHLLSNGLALTPSRFTELVGLGVRSLSFSVDGMSAQSHDLLRIGSKIDRLLPRIEELARLRHTLQADVRMGIAWTITRTNIAELPSLIAFAARAGLDWVKVEEIFPINPRAAGEAVADDVLAQGVSNARTEAARLGVRLLDHTHSPQVFKCRLNDDENVRAFSLGDDFINRMEINSCRLPWEVVCVEPNGDVRPMSFHHPVVGNILEKDLLELWNTGLFTQVRRQSMAARPCLRTGPTCEADGGPERW